MILISFVENWDEAIDCAYIVSGYVQYVQSYMYMYMNMDCHCSLHEVPIYANKTQDLISTRKFTFFIMYLNEHVTTFTIKSHES